MSHVVLEWPWWATVVLITLVGTVFYRRIIRIIGIVIVPENSMGIVNRRFKIFGKNKVLPDGHIIALNGEAGWQADTLPPGLHFCLWPWQNEVMIEKFTEITKEQIGVVESIDGVPISGGRVLGRGVPCESFQDARAFLAGGGERGPQLAIIPPGTYRINTQLFRILKQSVTIIADDCVGVVTTKDGKPLPEGEIAGKPVIDPTQPETNHNSYQDGQKFVDAGGFRGLQSQIILAGRYLLNPLFVSIEFYPLTEVPIAHVGVVISYVGDRGDDLSGINFEHGNLVAQNKKGVWQEALDPGRYAINPRTTRVEMVPTSNVILNWANTKSEAHKLDANLSTITLRSSDGFKFNLDVAQVIHIAAKFASMVIARFGSMSNLVTSVLEPTIGNYFRNAAQTSDVLEFLRNRTGRQMEAKKAITEALKDYNVVAVDTLIGDIVPPEPLMKTLTDRKIAEQENVTYATQKLAQETRKDFEQAKVMADTQTTVVAAERQVSIKQFEANAAIERARGEAEAKTVNARADAEVTRVNGEANALASKAVGMAQAEVLKAKSEYLRPDNYTMIEVAKSLQDSKQPLVPQYLFGGAGGDASSALMALLSKNLLEKSPERRTPGGVVIPEGVRHE